VGLFDAVLEEAHVAQMFYFLPSPRIRCPGGDSRSSVCVFVHTGHMGQLDLAVWHMLHFPKLYFLQAHLHHHTPLGRTVSRLIGV